MEYVYGRDEEERWRGPRKRVDGTREISKKEG